MPLDTVIYRANATATGGRNGQGTSNDGQLNVKLVKPKELGGTGEPGTNPEQLFAVGYAACFLGAMQFVAGRDKIAMPADVSINALVGISPIPNGFTIEVKLRISLPGMSRDTAQTLVHAAHIVCPYSNATRGNIDVTLTIE